MKHLDRRLLHPVEIAKYNKYVRKSVDYVWNSILFGVAHRKDSTLNFE